MTDLHHLANQVHYTVARSGPHYLLADEFGRWVEVQGSPLMTERQAWQLIDDEMRRRRPSQKALNQATLDFLGMAKGSGNASARHGSAAQNAGAIRILTDHAGVDSCQDSEIGPFPTDET